MVRGVYKRPGSSHFWITFQEGGKQRRESTGSPSRRVAERLLALRKGQALEARLGLPRSHTPLLREFAKEFLEGVSHDRTRDRYQDSVNALNNSFGRVRIGDITPEAIFRFQRQRLSQGRKGATVNRDVSVLSGMLRRAKKLHFIQRNPCEDVDSLPERKERRMAQPLNLTEETRLLACCDPMMKVFAMLIIDTGLRPRKEAASLPWANVELKAERPFLFVAESKTPAGIRSIPLTRRCVGELIKWQAFCGADYSAFVFPSPRGPGKHWKRYQESWVRAIAKAGLSGRRVYDLRSTFATWAHAVYPNNLAIARLLGHSSPAILPTYAKSCESVDYEVIDRMESFREAQIQQMQMNMEETRLQ
jgi:integrase